MASENIIIVGCGFLGKAAAQLFLAQGKQVLGIVRSAVPSMPSDSSFQIASCDVTDIASVRALAPKVPPSTLMVYTVSSGKGGSEAYAAIYRDGLQCTIEAWQPERTIFVSSTSVYAQTDGTIVTEESPTQPTRETGRLLLEAEAIALASGGLVARFSGIYGPGRSVLLQKFLAGTATLEEGGKRWINQIHRDDGARALWHLGTTPHASGIYNVTDDTPATQHDVYAWMADYYHQLVPPNGPADLNRKRGWTSKRVSNEKLRVLGWTPQFPSYKEALPQLAV